jgi:hypothetical protein
MIEEKNAWIELYSMLRWITASENVRVWGLMRPSTKFVWSYQC